MRKNGSGDAARLTINSCCSSRIKSQRPKVGMTDKEAFMHCEKEIRGLIAVGGGLLLYGRGVE